MRPEAQADKFAKDFEVYVRPGLLDPPELLEEVAKLVGLPVTWQDLNLTFRPTARQLSGLFACLAPKPVKMKLLYTLEVRREHVVQDYSADTELLVRGET